LHTGLALHAPVMCVSCIQGCHCTLLSCVSLAYRSGIARSCHVCLLHTGLALHAPVMCVSCIQGCHCTLLSCVSLAYRAGIAHSCHVCLLHTGLAPIGLVPSWLLTPKKACSRHCSPQHGPSRPPQAVAMPLHQPGNTKCYLIVGTPNHCKTPK